MKVTLAEVAQHAGVSPSTAARVVHASGYVSSENRRRVEQSIRDLGYRPNIQARGLRQSRSYVIGLVLTSAAQNPYFTRVSHAVRTAANAVGLSVLNFNHSYDSEVEREGIRRFIEHGVEAVAACHLFDQRNADPLIALGIPIIEIERRSLPVASHLLFDPLPGMTAAVAALKSAGHDRIAFLGGRTYRDTPKPLPGPSVEDQRQDAFLAALGSAGYDPKAARINLVDYVKLDDPTTLQGAVWAEAALSAPDRPTALICGSDVLAAGVLQVAYRLGLRIPDDLAIIGYDDSLALFLAPPVASIAQPYEALGPTLMDMIRTAGTTSGLNMTRTLPTAFTDRPSYRC